jgi:hypothetical protein
VIREDRINPRLLFAGTEFGFSVSLDGGASWAPLMNNLPATVADDVVVHPRDQDLVLATHGRSFYVLDDISALQQLSDAVLAKPEHLFRLRTAVLWDEDKRAWHGGGDELWRAKNPPDAIVSYYLKAAAPDAKLAIVDAAGEVVRELSTPPEPGMHRVTWNLRATSGARITPGVYTVRLSAGGRTSTTPLSVVMDPNR